MLSLRLRTVNNGKQHAREVPGREMAPGRARYDAVCAVLECHRDKATAVTSENPLGGWTTATAVITRTHERYEQIPDLLKTKKNRQKRRLPGARNYSCVLRQSSCI